MDGSVKQIIIIAGGVLGLFAVYFLLTVLSNRSVQDLARVIRRRSRNIEITSRSKFFSLPMAIVLLSTAAIGLIAILVLFFKAIP
jgi:ABC-type antimicrobial peptide transport system permease subunit